MVMNFAPGVETTLSKSSLAVSISAVGVATLPGYSRCSCHQQCTIWFGLFGLNIADKAPVSNILEAILGNVGFVDEEDSISALDMVTYTLGEVAKFIS